MTRIKICGVTRPEDVRACLELGVDAIGFNLARGPRKLTIERAAELVALVPPPVCPVLLVADAGEDDVLEWLRRTRCQAVQLHGAEPAELAARLRARLPVIKAFAMRGAEDLATAAGYPCDVALLDSGAGGTGTAWDHRLLAGRDLGKPVMLAGGLTADNVAAAIAALRPWAVDTAGGVESTPGIKDRAHIARFVAACRDR